MRRRRDDSAAAEDVITRDKFASMYREQAPAVYRLARRLVGSDGEAEDIVSETFVVAWRRWDELVRDTRPTGPWLLGVAARQALNTTRGRRRRTHLVAVLSGRAERESHPDPADEVVLRLDELRSQERARRAFGSLTAQEAEALALCVWSELSYAEAAEALEVSVASVQTRLARARRKLRARLSPDRADDAPGERAERSPGTFMTTTARSLR